MPYLDNVDLKDGAFLIDNLGCDPEDIEFYHLLYQRLMDGKPVIAYADSFKMLTLRFFERSAIEYKLANELRANCDFDACKHEAIGLKYLNHANNLLNEFKFLF